MQGSYVKLAHLLACDLRKRAIKVCVLALSRRNITSTLTPCQESWSLAMVSRDLAKVLRELYPSEPTATNYLDQLRAIAPTSQS